MWLQLLPSLLHSDDNNLDDIPRLHRQSLSSTKRFPHVLADRLVCVWTVHVNLFSCFFQSRGRVDLSWCHFCVRFLKDGFPPAMFLPVPAGQVPFALVLRIRLRSEEHTSELQSLRHLVC